jgi:tRNA 2-thiouridine synthesizing protein E
MTAMTTHDERLEYVFGIHNTDAMDKDWNRQIATLRASELGVELESAHWEVVTFLRQLYEASDGVMHARQLSSALQDRFADRGGLKYLYELFPGGPVLQGSYIAGMVPPKDSTNLSFGYAM